MWKSDEDIKFLVTEYWQFVEEIVERMLQWGDLVGSHWQTLINSYNNLASAARPRRPDATQCHGHPDYRFAGWNSVPLMTCSS